MFKSLLLAVDASHYSEVCTRYALEYARMMNAHVKVLTVLDRKELAVVFPYYYPSADFPPVFDELLVREQNGELFEQQKARAEQRVAVIEEQCRQLNLDCIPMIQPGLVPDVILDESQYCDLLFLGSRGSGAVSHSGFLGSNLERIVRKCTVPVLVTPHIYRPLQTILICFDGSEYSVKALHSVADLASSHPERNVSVMLLVVSDTEEAAQKIANKALGYLETYNLKVTVILKTGNPVEQIDALVQKEEIDLVAMGAYGHTRFRELVLGSTTETILHRLNRAILLQH